MSTVLAPTPSATHHPHVTREVAKRQTMSSPRPLASSATARSTSQGSRTGSSPSGSPPQQHHHPHYTQAARSQPAEERRDTPTGLDGSSPDKRTPADSRESHAKLNALADASSASQPAIKQERAPSPEMASTRSSSTTRHRPSRLDLTNSTPVNIAPNPNTAGLTSREPRTGQLTAMQDVGLACISPGFQTDNPSMQQQLAKALQTRDQQRHIIESRLNKTSNETIAPAGKLPIETVGAGGPLTSHPPGTSKRRGPPPGLSINAPSASHFSNEPRVVQSAPINQSFTGLRIGATGPEVPLSRQVLQHSHRQEHPVPPQTAHRLPPIQDVIGGDLSNRPPPQLHRTNSGQLYAPITNAQSSKSPITTHHPGRVSPPGYPPPSAGYAPHQREHYSGDETQAQGGRREDVPKIVHYGGHQPPTPPSPLPPNHQHAHHHHHQHHGYPQQQGSSSSHASSNQSDPSRTGRRRTREEFERDYIEEERGRRHDAIGGAGGLWEARMRADSPETSRRKKEEFMNLVSRAWDLLKS